jgi:hypothetical protein
MPRMIPICFGRIDPDRANVRNMASITAPAAKITRPGVGQAADHRLACVVAAVPVLLPLMTRTESAGSVPHKVAKRAGYGAGNDGRARTMQAIITRGGTV